MGLTAQQEITENTRTSQNNLLLTYMTDKGAGDNLYAAHENPLE